MKLELKNVSKNFGSNVIIKNVNMVLESGKIYGFVGRNGSGKVAFEVPDSAENVIAEYTNNIWTDDIIGFEYSE